MKKIFFLLGIILSLTINAQNWSLTGNAGTTPGTNFIGTTDNKDLVFKTNNMERIKVNNNGNIYIGDASLINNYSINLNNSFITAGSSAFYVNSNDEKSFRIIDGSTNWNYMRVAASDEYNSAVFFQESDGKVIIGSSLLPTCSDCNQYKLFVKGGIRTEQVKVDIATGIWADYVFKKDYRLRPLEEVEKFIVDNGHLPEVPSEKEAIENGIELKEMNILLLKKVEELTLYMIEQNKVNKQQEAKLNQKTKEIEDLKKAVNTLLANTPKEQN